MSPSRLRDLPITVARCAVLALLIAGLVLYGGSQAPSQGWLENSLIVTGVFYAVAGLISTDGLRIGGWLPIMALLTVSLGWLSACQPASLFDANFRVFLPITPSSWWPWGTVDADLSVAAMRRIAGLLGALLMAHDMGSRPRWRQATLAVIVWAGVAAAGAGLATRMHGDLGNYWGTLETTRFRNTVFGFFWYHGNAGAFMNLCWPLILAAVWREFSRDDASAVRHQFLRAIYVLALLLVISAIWINLSRAAQAVFLVQYGILLAMQFLGRADSPALQKGVLRRALGWTAATILAIGVMAMAFGVDRSLDKWINAGFGGLAADGRWEVLRTCSRWFGEVSALGYGPGTFSAVFIVKTAGMSDSPVGYWQFAHNDYLQTYLEWGWLGLGLWLALCFCILVKIAATAFRTKHKRGSRSALALIAITTALASVALHAIVDFPLQIFAIQLYAAILAGIGCGMVKDSSLAMQRKALGQGG